MLSKFGTLLSKTIWGNRSTREKIVFDHVTLITSKVKFMPVKKFSHPYRTLLPNIMWIGLISREIFEGDDNTAVAAD